jgi:NAD(P)H-flavin reductase
MGGGIGIAPLAAFAAELAPETYDFYAGFRSASFGLGDLKPRSLVTAIEDDGGGLRGRIPDFLDPAKYRAVYACGPEPMLRAVAAACGKAGVPCFISLERRMACGTGACLGCTVKTLGGNRRCCTDGPVFPAGELVFG